jgi:hypothetical protein
MPEQTPSTPPESPTSGDAAATPKATAEPSASTLDSIPFDIGEEFGTAKRNLPPAKIVAIAGAGLLVVLLIFAFLQKAKPQGGGSLDNITAVEIPDQNAMLVAVNVTLRNAGEKPLWIHTIKSTLKTESAEFSDEAGAGADFDRYFQAFPALKEHALPALTPETKIAPGNEAHGTVVVSFPVTKDAFDKRKSLSVVIQPYDQPVPVVLRK